MICTEGKSSSEGQIKEIACVLSYLLKSIFLSLHKLLFEQ